ncbi:MAG TPA: CBS domain-containing protein [Acidimicrobiales bacterium]|jgi:CBS domain-containing protein|nr:CBS domain-containing protein [Acidimicrobiales bacterium]
MEIASFITRSVLTLDEGASLRDAAIQMMERGVGSAVVMTGGKPTGIVTDRDALKVIAEGDDGELVAVRDCIAKKLLTASPETDVVEAARLMREKNFRHLVVVDDHGSLVGVFSMRDLVVGLLRERADLLNTSAPPA